MRFVTLAVFLGCALGGVLPAQTPVPVIVPATTPAKLSQPPGSSSTSANLQSALKMLQEIKAANEETLRKQTATLEQLDLLEKEAEQLKIYTKRG